jgi:hypothetical protein
MRDYLAQCWRRRHDCMKSPSQSIIIEGLARHHRTSHMTSVFVSRESRCGPLRLSRLGTDDAQASPGSTGCGGGPAFQQGFTWRRFEETPVPPRLWVASSSGGSVVLFRSRYLRVVSSRKGIDRRASHHVPAADLPSRLHARVA